MSKSSLGDILTNEEKEQTIKLEIFFLCGRGIGN